MRIVETIFARLAGHWQLERAVSGFGAMKGQAVFISAAPDRLDYREEGELYPALGQPSRFFRDYRYSLNPSGIAVAFADGAPFHAMQPDPADPWTVRGTHLCAEDFYRAVYGFRQGDPDLFTLRWDVQGPRKKYRIDTTFRREAY